MTACKACNAKIKDVLSEYDKALLLAQKQAQAENKTYVVVVNNGIYYPECLECRLKDNIQDGTIVAYTR